MNPRFDLSDLVEHILRLRKAERAVDPELRTTLADTREYLERTAGPTVRPAAAARLLGVTQTALNRWLDRGDVATVLTPEGRREVPLSEVVQLLEETRDSEGSSPTRPLAAVIRRRRRAAESEIDVDRLLPRRGKRTHRAPELQSLAYHRLVAERLNDAELERARRRLAQWRADGRIHERWADEWERVLHLPVARVARAISADTPSARELRQTSPFAGALNQQERRQLVEAVERRISS